MRKWGQKVFGLFPPFLPSGLGGWRSRARADPESWWKGGKGKKASDSAPAFYATSGGGRVEWSGPRPPRCLPPPAPSNSSSTISLWRCKCYPRNTRATKCSKGGGREAARETGRNSQPLRYLEAVPLNPVCSMPQAGRWCEAATRRLRPRTFRASGRHLSGHSVQSREARLAPKPGQRGTRRRRLSFAPPFATTALRVKRNADNRERVAEETRGEGGRGRSRAHHEKEEEEDGRVAIACKTTCKGRASERREESNVWLRCACMQSERARGRESGRAVSYHLFSRVRPR